MLPVMSNLFKETISTSFTIGADSTGAAGKCASTLGTIGAKVSFCPIYYLPLRSYNKMVKKTLTTEIFSKIDGFLQENL